MNKVFLSMLLFLIPFVFRGQEITRIDTSGNTRQQIEFELKQDTFKVSLKQPGLLPAVLPDFAPKNALPLNTNNEYDSSEKIPELHPPRNLKPDLFFNLRAGVYTLPVMGNVTTFAPAINFQPVDRLNLYGGVSFSQYHNAGYIQNTMDPQWPVKSNITANLFGGISYQLHERVILHANYQHTLYNQLPPNLMMFAPGFNVVGAGVSVDIWNGLGVTVEHVWEFDKSGRMRKGFRYSPYIEPAKLIKALQNW